MKTRGLGRVYRPKYPPTGKTYRDARAGGTLRESEVWWIQYSHRGQVHRESSRSTNHTDAVRLLKDRLGEIGHTGRVIGPKAEKVAFEDLATLLTDDYKINGRRSLDRAEDAFARLRAFFGQDRALDITPDRVMAYIRTRQEQKAANATIRNELAALKRAFTLAVKAEWLTHKPYIPSLAVQNVRTGFFEEAEFRAVVAELPEDLRLIVEFAYLTGWRLQEYQALQWRQVDFQTRVIRLEPGTTKNAEGREFPFGVLPPLTELLERQRARTTALERATGQIIPWVFHRDGEPIRDFRKAWLSACKRAGVPGRLRHDFRRTVVRNLERAGVPRSVAMRLTGHKTESVYRRYAIVAQADLRDGVAKLARLHEADRQAAPATLPHAVLSLPRTSKVLTKSGASTMPSSEEWEMAGNRG